jgi:hypothetical protein
MTLRTSLFDLLLPLLLLLLLLSDFSCCCLTSVAPYQRWIATPGCPCDAKHS